MFTRMRKQCVLGLSSGGGGGWGGEGPVIEAIQLHNVKVFSSISLNSPQVMDITKSNSEEVTPANPMTQEIWADITQRGQGF